MNLDHRKIQSCFILCPSVLSAAGSHWVDHVINEAGAEGWCEYSHLFRIFKDSDGDFSRKGLIT